MTDFWRSKRIIVTGGSGFLGGHFIKRLKSLGIRQIIAPPRSECDLTTHDAVRQLCASSKADMVIHLAAAGVGIGADQDPPGNFFYENLVMGVQLLEQARLAGIPKFVSVGTACSYPKHGTVPFKEDDIWDGYPEETNAPYGLAKKMLIVQSQAYRNEYGYKAICLLPVDLYGPGDNFDPKSSRLIPTLIRKFLEARDENAKCVEVLGPGDASREFLYVEDAVEGIVRGAEMYDDVDPVNLGTGLEIKICELVELIASLTGFSGGIRYDPTKLDGQPRLCLDTSRARERFGFVAKTSLETGLGRTIDWYESMRGAHVVERV